PAADTAAPAIPGQASTSVVDLTAKPGSEPVKKFTLTAAIRNIGGHEAWTFNGTVPGPELRVKTGDRVIVTLVNHLPGATSIHWHGIIVPNAMDDGAPNLRLDATPGDTVRLRIINAVVPGFDGAPLTPVLVGAPYVVGALDGHDLNAPQQLGPERLQLGMGQRADLVFTMPDKGAVRLVGLKGNAMFPWSAPPTASVTIGDGPTPVVNASSLPTFELTRYGLPAADPVADAGHYDVTRDIVLGGGPTFRNGSFDFSDTFDGMASLFVH